MSWRSQGRRRQGRPAQRGRGAGAAEPPGRTGRRQPAPGSWRCQRPTAAVHTPAIKTDAPGSADPLSAGTRKIPLVWTYPLCLLYLRTHQTDNFSLILLVTFDQYNLFKRWSRYLPTLQTLNVELALVLLSVTNTIDRAHEAMTVPYLGQRNTSQSCWTAPVGYSGAKWLVNTLHLGQPHHDQPLLSDGRQHCCMLSAYPSLELGRGR